jgi:hypothetical protein
MIIKIKQVILGEYDNSIIEFNCHGNSLDYILLVDFDTNIDTAYYFKFSFSHIDPKILNNSTRGLKYFFQMFKTKADILIAYDTVHHSPGYCGSLMQKRGTFIL